MTHKYRGSIVVLSISKSDVAPRVDNIMTDTPKGPMTRSRAKAIQDKVNSLLSRHQFNLAMDGLLPQADTLCILRYELDDKDMEGGKGNGQGDEGKGEGSNRRTIRHHPPDDPAPEAEEAVRDHRTIR